ncbi:MAG: DUF1465 family protein [Pseudomonadota bacterium]
MSEPAATTFFGKTYDETLALIVATRDYVVRDDPARAPGLPAFDRLRVHREIARLSARLMQMMAWLLAQKAVHAGELSRAAAARFGIEGERVCREDADIDGLPPPLLDLLASSRRLCVRIARLDELVRCAGD